MKQLDKIMYKVSNEVNYEFAEYEFTHKEVGCNEALTWLFKTVKTNNLYSFAIVVANIVGLPTREVISHLKGKYRDIFDIADTFGENYIDLKI